MKIEYTYAQCDEGTSQYDNYDLSEEIVVSALYVKAKVPLDKGNCFIEALPYPRSEEDIRRVYTKTLPGYDHNRIKDMTKLEKMLQVGTLREIRFPLPFHKNLEFDFYNALLTSYRARSQMMFEGAEIEYIVYNNRQTSSSLLLGDSAGATNSGFSLIGYSGCGKSSAIKILTSHYPHVIIHQDGMGGYFPQIVYLVVNCVANSNFSALYEGIGDAIDKAFGNTSPVYAREIARTAGLGKKAEKVKELIEKFAVGIIVFDEIQLLDFEHTRENSFDSLLTLANRTKVAIAVVGTEDARDKMFKELRTARRVGNMINGNLYCESPRYFSFLVSQLFRYQWFDEPVEVTDEIVETLYDQTKGIVDQLIGIYSYMHYDYLDKKKKPEINAEYIRKVAKKYYPGIQSVLANLESVRTERQLREIRENAEQRVNEILDKVRQEEEESKTLAEADAIAQESVQLSNVVANITTIYEFSGSQIEEAFKKVMNKKSSSGKSEKDISRLVVEQLQKMPKRKTTKNKIEAPDMQRMRDFLGIDDK